MSKNPALADSVRLGVEARRKFYAALDETDMQELGSGTPKPEIAEFEVRVGASLPDAYREFLGQFGSWKMVDPVSDLFDVRQISNMIASPQWREWLDDNADLVEDSKVVVPIGWSTFSSKKYLLALTQRDRWLVRVVDSASGVIAEFDGFLEYLSKSTKDFNLAVAEAPPAIAEIMSEDTEGRE